MRGRGIGEMLIAQAEKELKNRGFSSLSLAVAKGNPANLPNQNANRNISLDGIEMLSNCLIIGEHFYLKVTSNKKSVENLNNNFFHLF
jgi:GNAT superfamily N-acetyltransferase